jgi:hypothetical protein
MCRVKGGEFLWVDKQGDGSKLVEGLLATDIPNELSNGRHKQGSVQHTLACKKTLFPFPQKVNFLRTETYFCLWFLYSSSSWVLVPWREGGEQAAARLFCRELIRDEAEQSMLQFSSLSGGGRTHRQSSQVSVQSLWRPAQVS